jgi:hypothetical protein
MTAFDSAAVAAYLGEACYDVPLEADYVQRARELVREAFERQAGTDGLVELEIRRLFAIALRP